MVETVRAQRDEEQAETLREIAGDAYAGRDVPRMRYGELVEAVKNTAKCSERTAQDRVNKMKRFGIVRQVPPRLLEYAA